MANVDIYLEKEFGKQGGLKERLIGADRLFDTGWSLVAFAACIGYRLHKEKGIDLRNVNATAQKNSLTIKISTNSERADAFVTDLFAILEVKDRIDSENKQDESDQNPVIKEVLEALKEDKFGERCQKFNQYVHTGLHHILETHNEQNLPYQEVVLKFALDGPFCFEESQ